jgi:iron complex outermembrane receptor protein
MRLCVSIIISLCFISLSSAQQLSGRVADETNTGLPFVNVSLPALHRGTVTNDSGSFSFVELHKGVYTVEFTILGYGKETRTVKMESGDVRLLVTMHQTALELPGVIVTGKPQPTDVLSSSQSVSSVGGRELSRLRGENVMQALANTPGVSLYTTGAGIAKPVIRGLTSQRVLVISDGIRQEGQQWGDEHAPEIDGFDVERIEVLRGPSSVLYGSDALGGVVNVIKHDVPSVQEGDPRLGGEMTVNGFSNNRHAAGDLSLDGAEGIIGYRGHLSMRNAGDVTTPEGRLFNSGLEQIDGGGLLGAKGEWGAASVDYSHFDQELQIHEDPAEDPLATPYQKIQHDKVHVHGDFPLPDFRLETDGSWQKNVRREFEEKDVVDPALHLLLDSYSLDVKGHHQPIGPVFGTIGFSVQSQKNETLAEEKLIPRFRQLSLATFLYEEARIGKFGLSAGFRYDNRELNVGDTPDLGVVVQTRRFDATTGNAGVVFRAADALAFTANVGTGWRSPTPFELFVDGVHEGTVQYLIGDNSLKNEQSLNVDLSARYVSDRIRSEFTVYRNKIRNYIYASPTGDTDPESGFRKYILRQSNASLSGAEVSLEALLTDWCVLNGGFDYLRATNDMTSGPLPLTPANRVKAGVKITRRSVGGISNPYISVDVNAVFSQNRVEEFETPTAGYNLVDIGVGGEIPIGSQIANIDVCVKNLFDRAYRDHLNRFKEYALNPGRDFEVKVAVPFVISR